MLGNEGQGVLHGGLPLLHGLAGQAVNQVQREIFKPGLLGGGHRLVRLPGAVGTVDRLQLRWAGRLHAQGQAVEARLPQALQGLQIHAVRVGLQGDLRPLLHGKQLLNGRQQLPQPLVPVKAGGAAAEVDGVHGNPLGQGRGLRQMGQQRLLVVIHPVLPAGQGVKVTVVALAAAEGYMNVNAQLVPLGGLGRRAFLMSEHGKSSLFVPLVGYIPAFIIMRTAQSHKP